MIKWIGQHIWDFVSRFRNDVYLEAPATTDTSPDKFLALDASNKIIYREDSQLLTDIGVGTSSSPQFTEIQLGHASDTTLARSTAGAVTIEGNKIETRKTLLHIQQTAFNRDIATTEYFIPFNTTAESANITNIATPMVMPVDGKLLKIHMRVNQNHNTSSNTCTFKLYDIDDGEIWSAGNADVLGTKVIDGTVKQTIMVADFTNLDTTGASGTNAFSANDTIGVTITNSQDLATTNYVVTFVFELDFNSY